MAGSRVPSAWQDLSRLSGLARALELRARTFREVDLFLRERGSLPVDTPLRVGSPGTDVHIAAVPAGDGYLVTSPELHMKRLVAAGYGRIHQVCHCFRSGERGPLHNPEFSMLEWYWAGASYEDLARELECMLPAVARAAIGTTVLPGRSIDLAAPFERVTVREAFERHAGWSPGAAPDEDRFFLDLVEKVEPTLGRTRPTLLVDYPIAMAALARAKPSDPTLAERFELFVDGVELVNAFDELGDPVEQRARFEADNRRRAAEGKPVYPIDERFLAALGSMPRTAGAALGLDRLVMLLAGSRTIDEVVAFPEPWL